MLGIVHDVHGPLRALAMVQLVAVDQVRCVLSFATLLSAKGGCCGVSSCFVAASLAGRKQTKEGVVDRNGIHAVAG